MQCIVVTIGMYCYVRRLTAAAEKHLHSHNSLLHMGCQGDFNVATNVILITSTTFLCINFYFKEKAEKDSLVHDHDHKGLLVVE